MTFGDCIRRARKAKGIKQIHLAPLILKEDGESISVPYLNDLEHGRRKPPGDEMLEQFARVLDIKPVVLYVLARRLPLDSHLMLAAYDDGERFEAAYNAFRREVMRGVAA